MIDTTTQRGSASLFIMLELRDAATSLCEVPLTRAT